MLIMMMKRQWSHSSIQRAFLEKYSSCFLEDLPKKLRPIRPKDQRIDITPSNSPPNILPYRLTMPQQEEIRKQVNDLLDRGLIQPNSSPYCSLAIHSIKKDGSFRMCVNYRALNKITIKNKVSYDPGRLSGRPGEAQTLSSRLGCPGPFLRAQLAGHSMALLPAPLAFSPYPFDSSVRGRF